MHKATPAASGIEGAPCVDTVSVRLWQICIVSSYAHDTKPPACQDCTATRMHTPAIACGTHPFEGPVFCPCPAYCHPSEPEA